MEEISLQFLYPKHSLLSYHFSLGRNQESIMVFTNEIADFFEKVAKGLFSVWRGKLKMRIGRRTIKTDSK